MDVAATPTLSEQLLLLGLDDEKGGVSFSASMALPYGLAGATLMELILRGRLTTEDGKLVVTDPSPTGDDLLDEATAVIGSANRPRDAKHWVSNLNGKLKRHERRLEDRLVSRGVLRRDERKLLWLIPDNRYPTVDPGPEADVRQRIRAVLLQDAEPDARTAVLISLAKACEVLDPLLASDERRAAKQRIKEITEGEVLGRAVGDAVADQTVASTAAIVAATAASTVASSAGNGGGNGGGGGGT